MVVLVESSPNWQFRLKVDAKVVCRVEASLRRAPRVEPYMVDAILFADREITIPLIVVHCYMTSKWKHTGIVLATEQCLVAIYDEMTVFRPKVTKSEGCCLLVRLSLTFYSYV